MGRQGFTNRSGNVIRMTVLIASLTAVIAGSFYSSGCSWKPSSRLPGAEIRELRSGSFPRWCAANDLITFTDKQGDRYEVFTMRPDGTDVRCLTAGQPALSGCGNRGQSAWSSDGRYIIFGAENASLPRIARGAAARPGWGRNYNIWIMTSDGGSFWQLTDYPDNWAVFEAYFSHDGTKVCWGEEYEMEKYPNGKPGDVLLPGDNPTGPPWGHPGAYHTKEQFIYRKGEEMLAWRIVYADITFGPGGAQLSNSRRIEPPAGITMDEVNGFTPDDGGFIGCYSVLAETNGRATAGELFTCDLEGSLGKRLTTTPARHDEDPCYSPDGSRIVYKETKGIVGYEDDIYVMNADGTGARQLTHFAEPGYPEYDPLYVDRNPNPGTYFPSGHQMTEMSFSPDGKQVVFGHCRSEPGSLESMVEVPSYLYMLTIPD